MCRHALWQKAARAQRASVQPSEVQRYERYNDLHGAKYVPPNADDGAMDEDDW